MAARFESIEAYLSHVGPGEWEVWKKPGEKIEAKSLADQTTRPEKHISRVILAGKALGNIMSLQPERFAMLIGRSVGEDMAIIYAIPFAPRAGEENDIRDATLVTREELDKMHKEELEIIGLYKPYQDDKKIAALLGKNLGLQLVLRQDTSAEGFKLQAFARNRQGNVYQVQAINIL